MNPSNSPTPRRGCRRSPGTWCRSWIDSSPEKSNPGLLLHIAAVGPAHRRPGAGAAPACPAAADGGRAGREEGPQPADPPGGRDRDGGRDLRPGRAVELRGPVRLGVPLRRGDHRGVRHGGRQQEPEPQVEAGRATGGGAPGRLFRRGPDPHARHAPSGGVPDPGLGSPSPSPCWRSWA